jgi:alcohol dehydrogenase class IV
MERAHALHYTYASVAQAIVCGPDTITDLCQTLATLGAQTAMIVCGPSILRSADVIQRVRTALGSRCVGLFAGVAPHAPVFTLDEAMTVAREAQPQALISVGGGSTHDTSKGIATLLGEGGNIHDYEIHFEPPDKVTIPALTRPKIPIIAIPTTMGGAELSRGAGFTDHALGRKLVVGDQGTIPRNIVIDGQALATTPTPILVATAMGQFRIAVETVYSRRHNPIGDALALHAIGLLVRALPRCAEKAIPDLLEIKTAACMASLASVGGLGLNTAMAHHVGGLYNVPHGEANAILLPHTMRFNLEASAERQALIAEAMGVRTAGMRPHEAGLAAAEAAAALCQQLGLPSRLRDVDVPQEGLEAIAAATLHDRALATNPIRITDAAPILSVLRAAW